MASFDVAYDKYVKPLEGGYSNESADAGGETYGGIARNYNPSWSGWAFIDQKKKTGAIKRYTIFKELDAPVRQFYLGLWNSKLFGQIKNQDIANILFDWFVNSGSNYLYTKSPATFGTQEILNQWFGKSLITDGAIGPKTIEAINQVDQAKLYAKIKEQRKVFYDNLVANKPSQSVFYNGWIGRLKAFPDAITSTGVGIVGVLLLIGAGYVIYRYSTSEGSKVALTGDTKNGSKA